MGSISLEKVQKILHLDVEYPQFPSYEQYFEFMADGITVKAVAAVKWRSIQIDIIEPFQILAWDFYPPLIALGVVMLHRQEALLKKGMTNHDDFIEKARNAYIRHVTYLRLKPEIDVAQEEFMSVFREELQSLEATNLDVQTRVAHEKIELRKKLKSDQISQKELQIALRQLSKEAFDANFPFSDLNRQVEMALSDIKDSMIEQALSQEPKKT